MFYVGAEGEWKAYFGIRWAHTFFNVGGGDEREDIHSLCLILNTML